MKPIQEVFLETEWDDEASARQARDARANELQAKGLFCNCENLYTVDGYRVFLVEATEFERDDPATGRSRDRQNRSSRSSERLSPKDNPPVRRNNRAKLEEE